MLLNKIFSCLYHNELTYITIINILVKLFMRCAFIEAYYDIILNEIIEYDITNDEPTRFKKNLIRIIDKIHYP